MMMQRHNPADGIPASDGARYNEDEAFLRGSDHLAGERTRQIIYRDAIPQDLQGLQSSHYEMFPVDYEESFFEKVVHHQDGLENLIAVSRNSDGEEAVVGFVTARVFRLWECDPADRLHLSLDDRLLDHELVFYILTLAVSPPFRKQGIGSRLVTWVTDHARKAQCRAAYLHVIDYNAAAMALYRQQGFQQVACRDNFYHITSGRQPDPDKQLYDAFLYAYILNIEVEKGPLSFLILAFAPLSLSPKHFTTIQLSSARSIIGQLQSCLTWGPTQGSYFGGGSFSSLERGQQCSWKSANMDNSGAPHFSPWLRSLFMSRKQSRHQ